MKIINSFNLIKMQSNQFSLKSIQPIISRCLSTSFRTQTYQNDSKAFKPYPEPKRWPEKNLVIHTIDQLDDKPVDRYYCHYRSNIKYSPKKMWFIASLIRGMAINEAIKQLSFIPKKGAQIIKEVLLEAQEIAVREQNFEYKTNMWIAESFATKGLVVKGIRKHARMRFGEIRYFHCHYFVRLVEGLPPLDYYGEKRTGHQLLDEYVTNLRSRRIDYGL